MDIHGFFARNADAFTQGDMTSAAETLCTPATIHVGHRRITVPDRVSLVAMLKTYRANLMVESYVETRCSVEYVTDAGNGRYQAFVNWRHLNDQGAEISQFDATYILRDAGEGRLQCITAEILPPVKERMVQGLPLV